MNGANGVSEVVNRLVDEYRARCLWFLRSDFYPNSTDETIRTLRTIERYGDREAFRKAAELRRWLSHPSSAGSADS